MGLLLQTTSSCVSPFIQKAAIEAISGDQTEVKNMLSEYKSRRDLLVKGINSINGLSCIKPNGAFYIFVNIKKTGMTSEDFANFLLDNVDVAVLPGTNFGEFGEGYIRLCYAKNKQNIEKAIEKIKISLSK
jgi:aspartate/methionine/tyrosine aminotransferase